MATGPYQKSRRKQMPPYIVFFTRSSLIFHFIDPQLTLISTTIYYFLTRLFFFDSHAHVTIS